MLNRAESNRSRSSIPLVLAACAVSLVSVFPARIGRADPAASPDKDAAHCNAPTDIAALYGAQHVSAQVYRFDAANGGTQLVGSLDDMGPSPFPVATVYVALAGMTAKSTSPADASVALFEYGADGCFVDYLATFDGKDPIAVSDVLKLFAATGVIAPFGTTSYQVPGVPGSAPGFIVGGISS